ncbi:MAG: nucleotidyl transferase AbiEii/AbiGii toxin family protein [Tenericutes bacterium]|nr:nucleotidyl transferase AbiEii/AbiGii toxin family protein [Mycoplasmatota bacterium]
MYCKFKTIKYHFKLDFSTGDIITPKQKELMIPLYFTDNSIELFAYPVETILSEKVETILSRNIANTRMKDFYDVYILAIRFGKAINKKLLKEATINTIKYRGTLFLLEEFKELYLKIVDSEELKFLWIKYTSEYEFAKGIQYKSVMAQLKELLNMSLNPIKTSS